MSRRADTRGADDVEPEVPLLAHRRLTRVQAHPHADFFLLWPRVSGEGALSCDRAGHGVPRSRERVEEGVALRVDLRAALFAELVSEEPAVVADDLAVGVTELLEQPGRALDIGEQKRDRPAGEHIHARECMVEDA